MVRDSIVMFDSVIRSGAVVDRSILDKEVVVGPGAIVGEGPFPDKPNKAEPGRLNTGITVVGKRAVIPRGARIGRNVKVAADVTYDRLPQEGRQERGVRGTAARDSPRARPRGRRAPRPRRRPGTPASVASAAVAKGAKGG